MRYFLKVASALIAAMLLGGGLVTAQIHEVPVMPRMDMPTFSAPMTTLVQPNLDTTRMTAPALAAPALAAPAAAAQPSCTYRDAYGNTHC